MRNLKLPTVLSAIPLNSPPSFLQYRWSGAKVSAPQRSVPPWNERIASRSAATWSEAEGRPAPAPAPKMSDDQLIVHHGDRMDEERRPPADRRTRQRELQGVLSMQVGVDLSRRTNEIKLGIANGEWAIMFITTSYTSKFLESGLSWGCVCA